MGGSPETIDVPVGGTVSDMLAMTGLQPFGLHVFLNDILVKPEAYMHTTPTLGDHIYVAIVPQGGDSNKVIRSAAMIGVMLVAAYVSGPAGVAAFGSQFAASSAGLAVGLGGALLVNALIPPAIADTGMLTSASGKTAYSVTGVRNQALPFQPIPKTLGTDRVYPPYAANPYTYVQGNNQYVFMLFNLGRGPLETSDLKFGNTSIEDYGAKAYYGTGAYLPPFFDHGTVYQQDLSTLLDASGTGHTGDDETIVTTENSVKKISLDFYSPALLYAADDGSIGKVVVEVEVKYRENGESTWIDCDFGRDEYPDTNCRVNGNRIELTGYQGSSSRWGVDHTMPSELVYDIYIRRTKITVYEWITSVEANGRIEIVDDDWTESQLQDDVYLITLREYSDQTIDAPDDMHFVAIKALATDQFNGTPDNFNLIVSGKHPVYSNDFAEEYDFSGTANGWTIGNGTLTVDNTFIVVTTDINNFWNSDEGIPIYDTNGIAIALADTDWTLTKGSLTVDGSDAYTVQIRLRITNCSTTANIRLYWSTSGHGYTDSYYIDFELSQVGVFEVIELDLSSPDAGGTDWTTNTITGIQLKFTAQNVEEKYEIDYFRIESSGDTGWTTQVTSNPAWIYAELLTGSANHRAMALSKLDADELATWAGKCETNGYEYNATVSGRRLQEMMRVVCAAGRATFDITEDGKYSVIYDGDVQSTIYQVISARNSWGFRGSKSFAELPHCLRVPFRDRDNGYLPGQRLVYRDGYNAGNSTLFETMEFDGQVDPEMNYKFGRYYFAAGILRPEQFSVNMDFEYMVAGRGKRVAFRHDVPSIGISEARVKSIAIDGTDVTLTVDDICTFEAGPTYAILIRIQSGSPIQVSVDNPGAGEYTVLTTTLAAEESAKINAGDLLVFGESTGFYDDLIIKAIEPIDDYSAKLSLVSYDPDIYDDETVYGTIPDYDAVITNPVDRTTLPPPSPVIDQIVSDETVLIVQANGVLVSQMVISYGVRVTGSTIQADRAECQYKVNQDGYKWVSIPSVPVGSGLIYIPNVQDLVEYQIRIRFISVYGVPSDWVTEVHTVVGKTSPPPIVTNFAVTIVENQYVLSWDHITVADRKEYKIKYGSTYATWESGATFIGTTTNDTISRIANWTGIRKFLIKAFDTSNNPSDDEATVELEIIGPTVTGIEVSVIDNNVLFKWTNSPGTLPINFIELRKGTTFAAATVIGEKKGTFTSVFETVSGQYKYWLVPVDTAGNYGTEKSITATVNEPPDYVLNQNWVEDFDEGIRTNIILLDDGTAIAPGNDTETAEEHFTNNGCTTTQDFIDAGYTYAVEPVPTTAEYSETFDYEAILTGSMVTMDLDLATYNGGAPVVEYLAYKEDIEDAWTEDTDNPVYWNDFRYVRDRFEFESDGTQFCVLNSHSIRLDVKEKTDSGTGTITVANDGVDVEFNRTFADISSIITTPLGTTVKIGIVDFTDVPNPTDFTAYLYDTDGNKTTGSFSWIAKGF